MEFINEAFLTLYLYFLMFLSNANDSSPPNSLFRYLCSWGLPVILGLALLANLVFMLIQAFLYMRSTGCPLIRRKIQTIKAKI